MWITNFLHKVKHEISRSGVQEVVFHIIQHDGHDKNGRNDSMSICINLQIRQIA